MVTLASSSSNAGAFWAVCVIGLFAFAWIAGIAEIAGKPQDEFATGTRTTWLLLVIFTGLLGLVTYVLVGKKRDLNALPQLVGGHDIKSFGPLYVCQEPRCIFSGVGRSASRAHQLATGATEMIRSRPREVTSRSIEPPPPTPISAEASTSEFKMCPDCAEQVRFAARKCRFCNYLFESADVSG